MGEISDILKEKISADHLLYVSLKYTKTCDVILNLIARWKSMIEMSYDGLLEHALKNKKIPNLPETPKQRVDFMKKYFEKYEKVENTIPLYIFFKRIPDLKNKKDGEFRKNVCLRIIEPNKLTEINMDQLKEYAEILENFISEVRHILSK